MERFFSLVIYIVFVNAASADAFHTNGCTTGHFKLPGMEECHEWLKCPSFKDIELGERIGIGSTKLVHLARWNGFNVSLAQLVDENLSADFDHGLEMLAKYSPNKYIVQLVGFCKKAHLVVTEYHSLGNATSILSIINKKYGSETIFVRLKLCLNYAHILDLLHNGPAGTRVMCDSNDLDKLLSQILVTDNLDLVLNDLDALPLVDKDAGITVKCGRRELFGDFVAPEQRWPYTGSFKDVAMPGYDEKTDIWKAADVFEHFISDVHFSHDWVKFRLFNLFRSCKNPDPNLRPTASYIVSVLEKLLAEIALVKTEL